MAYTPDVYTGDGSTTTFTVTFPYISTSHVEVYLDDVLKTEDTDYQWSTSTQIDFSISSAPGSGVEVRIERNTPTARIIDYQDGGNLTEAKLDKDSNQVSYIAEETSYRALTRDTADDKFDAESSVIKNVTDPSSDQDAATRGWVNDQLVGSGNIPAPDNPADDNKVIRATGGSYDWYSFLIDWISDAASFMKTFLKSGSKSAARANLGPYGDVNVTSTDSTTARTLADRFADIINVKDFGAVGDGITDDTAAFQAAADDAANGATILVPEGDYVVDVTALSLGTKALFWQTEGATFNGSDKLLGSIINLSLAQPDNLLYDIPVNRRLEFYRAQGDHDGAGEVRGFSFALTAGPNATGDSVRGVAGVCIANGGASIVKGVHGTAQSDPGHTGEVIGLVGQVTLNGGSPSESYAIQGTVDDGATGGIIINPRQAGDQMLDGIRFRSNCDITGAAIRLDHQGVGDFLLLRDGGSANERFKVDKDGNQLCRDLTARVSDDGATKGPTILFDRISSSPAVNDIMAEVRFQGRNSVDGSVVYSAIQSRIVTPTSGSEDGELRFNLYSGGSNGTRMILRAGVQVGAPTGGDKGSGTINVANDIYNNNSAYTNPDYVLEKAATGKIERFAHRPGAAEYQGPMPLDELYGHIQENYRLPGIDDAPMGLFERGDKALEKIEELTLYVLELHDRIKILEKAE